MLNVAFKLKKAKHCFLPVTRLPRPDGDPSVRSSEAGSAEQQQVNVATVVPTIKDNDVNYLIVEGENFRMDFNRHDGFLCRYDVNGMPMLKEDGKLTPNFWRAPTDNDMGANLQNKYAAWKEPGLKLTSLTNKTENGMVTVSAEYTMDAVKAKLYLTIQLIMKAQSKLHRRW